MDKLLLLIIFTITLSAKELVLTDEEKNYISNNPSIKVSNEIDWYPYDFYEYGKPSGYAIDYLKLLANKIGLNVEFQTDTWNELSHKFKTKQIDILYPAKKTKEREKIALFSEEFINMRLSLVTKSKRDDIKSLEDMKDKTIALVRGWSTAKYIKNTYKDMKYIEFDTSKEALEAVAFGLADACVEDFFTANYIIKKEMYSNLHVASKVLINGKDNYSLHLMFQKENKILKELFDRAMKSVKDEEILKIRAKWIGSFIKKKNIQINESEKKYLKNKKIVKMCIDPNWMPLEMNKQGIHFGMTSDYMSLIEKEIGIPIELVDTKTWIESMEFAKKRKCDIFSLAMATPQRKLYMDFTKPYLSIPLVLVSTLDENFYPNVSGIHDKKIGIVKGYAYGEILRVKYPDMKLVEVESISDGLNRVEKKELFGLIGTLATVAYTIQREYFASLKIVGKFDEKWELGIGVRNDEPLLLNVLEKAIDSIDTNKHQEILNKWISVKYDMKEDYSNIIKFFIFVVIIFILILYRQNQLKKYNKKLEILSTTDKLTGIYNRLKLDEVLLHEKNLFDRYHRSLSIIIFDIDNFKKVNDEHGHKVGDEILQDMAKIILNNKRKTDVLGRWGGEEFLVICHETDLTGAIELAEKFRKIINTHIFSKEQQLSASFGVAEFMINDSIEKVFIRADKGLYQAKINGKNRVNFTIK